MRTSRKSSTPTSTARNRPTTPAGWRCPRIKKNDFDLNISSYICTAVGEEDFDLAATNQVARRKSTIVSSRNWTVGTAHVESVAPGVVIIGPSTAPPSVSRRILFVAMRRRYCRFRRIPRSHGPFRTHPHHVGFERQCCLTVTCISGADFTSGWKKTKPTDNGNGVHRFSVI